LDITDLYAFPTPGDSGKSILILNVHPSTGINPPQPTVAEPFAPGALYEFKIDTNGDATADIGYSVRVSSLTDEQQTATLRRIEGPRAVAPLDDGGVIVIENAPVSVRRESFVASAGDCRLFVGWRSDPFFFDPYGLFNHMQFTGADFFADKNVCSIVLEVPNGALGNTQVGLWARTLEKVGDRWIQVDRGGRPMQAVFLPGDERCAYLEGQPADDERFISVFAHQLERSGGYSPDDAKSTAKSLLPDILSYKPGCLGRYPDNGRSLVDDAADLFLAVLTNGRVTGDLVGPHRDLLDEFPYVGPPHP
jgi:hypothetical protein